MAKTKEQKELEKKQKEVAKARAEKEATEKEEAEFKEKEEKEKLEKEEKEAKEKEEAERPKGYEVFNKNGKYIRTYTKEFHGKDAKKLAEQYAEKIKGEVK